MKKKKYFSGSRNKSVLSSRIGFRSLNNMVHKLGSDMRTRISCYYSYSKISDYESSMEEKLWKTL
jgi:hypothetical protein